MNYDVKYTPNAERDLDEISPDQAAWIAEKAKKVLGENPGPRGNVVKQIVGADPPFSRLRAGRWRIFFKVVGKVVWILAVAPKPKAGRVIKRLMD